MRCLCFSVSVTHSLCVFASDSHSRYSSNQNSTLIFSQYSSTLGQFFLIFFITNSYYIDRTLQSYPFISSDLCRATYPSTSTALLVAYMPHTATTNYLNDSSNSIVVGCLLITIKIVNCEYKEILYIPASKCFMFHGVSAVD